jgi:hypothetical protein
MSERTNTFTTPSASITVERAGWRSTLVYVTTRECRVPVVFRFDRSGHQAAAWLAAQDLTGKVWAGQTWAELEEAVARPQPVPASVAVAPKEKPIPKATTEEVARLVERLVTQRVGEVLEEHYAWVLADKSRRRMWSQLVRDANALEAAAKIRQAAR